jgi:transposase
MERDTESNLAPLAVIGIDIGKDVFHLVGFGVDGKISFRRKIRRLGLKDAFEKLPPCIVGMEACLSAHVVSRVLRGLGHEPRIIPAIYTKPFVKGQKNDYNDAGDSRGSVTTEPARRPGEEPGSARPAGMSSRPVAIGLPPDSDDQPDPRFPA